MDKFFDIIKKLRVPAREGKVSRQAAIDALMMEANVSEDIAAKAADNLFKDTPQVSGGITSIKPEVTFTPTQKKLPEPIDMTVEERTGGLLTEEEAPGLFNLRREAESLADEESWKYSMSLYKQKKSKAMEPVYQKYGAQTQKDKELVDELYDVDFENKLVPNEFKSKPEYKESTAKIFIQESVEDIAGADDIVTSILYSDEATKFLENQGLDNYINYIHTQLKDQGLSFNKPLLKRFLKEKFEPEVFAVGGRVGFDVGTGRKGIIQSLLNKANEIEPGSTAVGKTTKAMNEAAKRKRAEEELFAGFKERNSPVKDEKVGQGKFTAAELLLQRLKNTLKTETDSYVKKNFPNFIKEIEANPKLADDPKVQEAFGLRDLPENQRLVEYSDGTFDFYTQGSKKGMGSVKELADEFGISMEEAAKIKMMEPEDQIIEIERRRTLKNRNLNADGGLNYLMGF